MDLDDLKSSANELRRHTQGELRWSYLINGTLVVIGLIVNHFLPHGWIVWPAVMGIGILVMLNEAVDRNGQGLPPIYVYACVVAVMCLWVSLAFLFSAIAPLLLFVGVPAAIVFGIIAYRKNLARQKLIAQRRTKGLCIHCGEPVIVNMGACGECGREVDREVSIRELISGSNRSTANVERAREILVPQVPTVAAKRKEQALLARRHKRTIQKKPEGRVNRTTLE